jgi:hypothetical protein
MNGRNNILGLYKFNLETFESNTDDKNQPVLFVEFDKNTNQILLRNSNLTFNPSTNTLNSTNINVTTNTITSAVRSAGGNFLSMTNAEFSANFFSTTYPIATNRLLFVSTDASNGRKLLFSPDITFNTTTKIFAIGGTITATTIDSTNLEVTNLKAIDGTACASIADSTGVITFSANVNATTIDSTNLEVTNLKAKDGSACASIADSSGVITFSANVNATTIDSTNLEVTNLKAKDGSACASIADSSGVITFSANVNATTIDSTNLEVTNLKAIDGTACASIADSSGVITFSSNVNATTIDSTNLEVTNLKAKDGSACASIADSNGEITFSANVIASSILSNGTTFSLKEKNDSAVMTISTENTGDTTSNASIELDQTNSKITLLGLNKKLTINATNRFEFENPSNVVLSLYTTTGNTDQKYIEVQNSSGSFNVAFLNDGRDSTFTPMILTRKLNSNLCASAFFSLETQFVLRDTSLTEKFVFDIANSSLKAGNLDIGTWNQNTGFSQFRHSSVTGVGDYALLQSSSGATFLNSSAGQVLNLGINNSYKLIVGTGGDITIPSNNLILSVGQIQFTHFQIAGSSSTFMGVLGFNRNVSDGTIFNSSFNAFQIHNASGKLHFQTYQGSNGAEIDANTMVLTSGEVAIAQATATEKLDVNGAVKATAFDNSSDDRVKKNEKNITNALSVINKLSCETYDKVKEILFKKEQPTNTDFDNFEKTTDEIDWNLDNYSEFYKEAGFIAQEVEQIDELKEFVKKGNENKLWTLNYNSIFTYAVKAIQELSQENTELKTKISNLEADIALIKNNLNMQ